MKGNIVKVSGPLVGIQGLFGAKMGDKIFLGADRIVGEVTQLTRDRVWALAFETTEGLKLGDIAEHAGTPLTMELGPGLLGGAYDGLGRSLDALYAKTGNHITPGAEVQTLDRTKRWSFHPSVTVGAKLAAGDIIGVVQESTSVTHKIMVPADISGTVIEVHSGDRTVEEAVVIVKDIDGIDHKLTMVQNWAIRMERPYQQQHRSETQVQIGVAEIDQNAPLVLGGSALLIGEEGSGQAALKQLLANGADVDVFVYLACGLSGSVCADVLALCRAQSEQKTVCILSPRDAEAAAQEATVYRGLTIASYYRDMGLSVVLILDNLGGFISASSETAGLMGAIAYEGGPSINLNGRLAELFAPAGVVTCLGTEKRQGSLSIIGTLSSEEAFEQTEKSLTRIVSTVWHTEDMRGECAND